MTTQREAMRAHADIAGDQVSGEADFVEVVQGTQQFVNVTVRLRGNPSVLTPGLHGVHIHEHGTCEPNFQAAGGHFDPGPASDPDPDRNHPYHMGDLTNILIDADGTGVLETVSTRITLSDGPLSILSGSGTTIMIHGNVDQMIPGPTGSGVSGGPRIACGVIKRVEHAT